MAVLPFWSASGSGAAHAKVGMAHSPRRLSRLDQLCFRLLQAHVAPARVRVESWDGALADGEPAGPVGTLVVSDRTTLLGLLLHPNLWFGEAYMSGRLEVRGPIEPVLEALSRLAAARPSWRGRLAAALAWPNSLGAARRNVQHHYDIGNDFYAAWLDPQMVYTCAFFPTPEATLDVAQTAKLERVCRKLRLRPGEHVVEAGCGWGALALHMARHYGVTVTAFNVSREQLEFARARAAREGLSGQVTFVDDDYRNVGGRCDAFVSLGMLEHVGRGHYRSMAEVLRRVLEPAHGRGLLHFIGRDVPLPVNAWIRRRIFPGAYVPTLAEVTTRVLTPAGMTVLDVENLRLHYARTLAHWLTRFERSAAATRARYGPELERAWRLYLAGSEASFATGWMQLFQVVFAAQAAAPPSWTRDDPFFAPKAVRAEL
jgi:cyclopropane-fatty-acyl-phospholipid synthase